MATGKGNQKTSLMDRLHALPERDGLRLATAFASVSAQHHAGGDIVRMSNNALRLAAWVDDQATRRLLVSDMSAWIEAPEAEAQRVADFFMRSGANDRERDAVARGFCANKTKASRGCGKTRRGNR